MLRENKFYMPPRPFFNSFLIIVFFLTLCGAAEALEMKSRFFDVRIDDDINLHEFYAVLNSEGLLRVDQPVAEDANLEKKVADSLDSLYLEVADILDIQNTGSKIGIEVFDDIDRMRQAIDQKYVFEPQTENALYVFFENKIYCNFQGLRLGILAHEIAHAVISHYFGMPPPEKIQEVLTGYVEYKIMKNSRQKE